MTGDNSTQRDTCLRLSCGVHSHLITNYNFCIQMVLVCRGRSRHNAMFASIPYYSDMNTHMYTCIQLGD